MDDDTRGHLNELRGRCGEPIVLQRLQVQPAAARCAPCQAYAERALPRGQFAR